jgi:cysteinyl-tRNA synthetase
LRKKAREISRCKELIRQIGRTRLWEDSEIVDRIIEKAISDFDFHINNDINTPEAIETLCSLVRKLSALIRKRKFGTGNAKRALYTIKRMDSILGFIF